MDIKRIKQLINEDKMVKFYQCKAWRTLRLEALRRDNYECQVCKDKGKYSSAEAVHHIKEVKERPDLALVLDNLQCICHDCHNKEHNRFSINRPKPFMNEERW